MTTKTSNSLPKTEAEITNGGLYRQSVRCGKGNCRCASGDLHEGYYYFIRFVNGRQRKTYVPKPQVQAISTLVRQARKIRQNERRLNAENRELLFDLRQQLREHDSMIKDLAVAQKGYD